MQRCMRMLIQVTLVSIQGRFAGASEKGNRAFRYFLKVLFPFFFSSIVILINFKI